MPKYLIIRLQMPDGDTTGWGDLGNSAVCILVSWDLFYESLVSSLILWISQLHNYIISVM